MNGISLEACNGLAALADLRDLPRRNGDVGTWR